MNTENGALHFESTFGNEKFNGAVDESKRRIQGFSDASVAAGEKIDDAFKVTTENIKIQKEVIANLENQLKTLNAQIDKLGPGKAQLELKKQASEVITELNAEKAALQTLEKEVKANETAHVSLRTRLRQLKEALVEMEAAGLRGTAKYEALRTEFAELTNAMGDAQKQASVLANDERGLQGVISGFTGLAGAASAAQGAMGLFTGENENLQRIMLKVQSLMAITIGLQQIQETLNKDSAFQLVVVAKANTILANATNYLSVTLGISNAAAKALMATLTLGLSIAITAIIVVLSKLSSRAAEARNDLQEFNKAAAGAAYKPLVEFKRLSAEWDSLGNSFKEKQKYIEDNAKAFEDLGIKVTSVSDAENLLVRNKDAFINSIIAKARAAAGMDLAAEKYKLAIQKMMEADTMADTKTRYVANPYGGGVQSYNITNQKKIRTTEEADRLFKEADQLIKGSIKDADQANELLKEGAIQTTGEILNTAEELKKLKNEIALARTEGQEKELLALKQQYQDDLEKFKNNEELKTALAEKYAIERNNIIKKYEKEAQEEMLRGLQKIKDENSKAAKEFSDPDLYGGTGILSRAAYADEKSPLKAPPQTQAQIEEQRLKNLQKEGDLRREIVDAATALVYQLGEALGLDEKAKEQLGGILTVIQNINTGNYLAAAVNMITTVISAFPKVAEDYANEIVHLNDLLKEQAQIIEDSKRKGNQGKAYQEYLNTLEQQQKKLEEGIKKTEKSQFWFGAGKKANKEFEAQLEELKNQIKDVKQEYDDFLTGGVTENSIADSIARGFLEGKTSVNDFASYLNETLLEAVMNIFKGQLLSSPEMEKFTQDLKTFMEDQVLTPEEVEKLRKDQLDIVNANKTGFDALTGGLNLSGSTSDKSLTGAIKGVTEQTASVVAGQMNAMRITQAEISGAMKQQLFHIGNIDRNINAYLPFLKEIDKKLGQSGLRSQGLT